MKDKLKLALWNKVKSTYPSGTSKHTNALLEEDFDSFLDEVVKICAIPIVGGSYIVFDDGHEEGVEGMIQLSNKFETLEEAKKYADSWKGKNTYITKLVE